jgi:hypothetical protein
MPNGFFYTTERCSGDLGLRRASDGLTVALLFQRKDKRFGVSSVWLPRAISTHETLPLALAAMEEIARET